MSSSPTDPGVYERMINSLLPCSQIYSKEYRHGTLFGLMFLKKTYVTDMHAQMVELDKQLRHNGPTKFTSICDILSGKIKSFGKNKRETLIDEHFNVIFKPLSGKKMKPQDDVNVWINPVLGGGAAGVLKKNIINNKKPVSHRTKRNKWKVTVARTRVSAMPSQNTKATKR